MPHIIVKLYPGRSEEQKTELARELTRTVVSVLGSRQEAVSVGIEDVAPADWTELSQQAGRPCQAGYDLQAARNLRENKRASNRSANPRQATRNSGLCVRVTGVVW